MIVRFERFFFLATKRMVVHFDDTLAVDVGVIDDERREVSDRMGVVEGIIVKMVGVEGVSASSSSIHSSRELGRVLNENSKGVETSGFWKHRHEFKCV